MPKEAAEKIYDTKELSAFFRVREETIWEWCKRGKIPAFKIGKKWRVRAEDLRRSIEQKIHAGKGSPENAGRLF